MVGVDGAGAARRRRERLLRSMLRHERQTVAMELAAALHHSLGVRPDVSYKAPRGQKTASSARGCPDVLAEAGVQGGSVAPRFPDAGVPTPAMLVLSGRVAELVDPSALGYLTASALEANRKEEEEEEKEEKAQKAATLQSDVHAILSSPWARGLLAQRHEDEDKRRRKEEKAAECPLFWLRRLRLSHLETWTLYCGPCFCSSCSVSGCRLRRSRRLDSSGRLLPDKFP